MPDMRLLDLNPRWLDLNDQHIGFMFRCPHCFPTRDQWLTCFFINTGDIPTIVSNDEDINGERGERLLFEQAFREMGYADPRKECWEVVSCNIGCAWQRTSDDFATMSVTPSLDASAAGHWHGFITNGQTV